MDCIDAVWEKEALNDLKTEGTKCDTDIIGNGDVRFSGKKISLVQFMFLFMLLVEMGHRSLKLQCWNLKGSWRQS